MQSRRKMQQKADLMTEFGVNSYQAQHPQSPLSESSIQVSNGTGLPSFAEPKSAGFFMKLFGWIAIFAKPETVLPVQDHPQGTEAPAVATFTTLIGCNQLDDSSSLTLASYTTCDMGTSNDTSSGIRAPNDNDNKSDSDICDDTESLKSYNDAANHLSMSSHNRGYSSTDSATDEEDQLYSEFGSDEEKQLETNVTHILKNPTRLYRSHYAKVRRGDYEKEVAEFKIMYKAADENYFTRGKYRRTRAFADTRSLYSWIHIDVVQEKRFQQVDLPEAFRNTLAVHSPFPDKDKDIVKFVPRKCVYLVIGCKELDLAPRPFPFLVNETQDIADDIRITMGCDVLRKTKLNLRRNSSGSTFLGIYLSKHLSKGEKAKKKTRIEENRNQQRSKALATGRLEAEEPHFKPNFSNAASRTTFTVQRSPDSFTTDTTEQDSLFSKGTCSTKETTATSYSTQSYAQSYTQSYTEEGSSARAQAGSWMHKGFVAEPEEIKGLAGNLDPQQNHEQKSKSGERLAKRHGKQININVVDV